MFSAGLRAHGAKTATKEKTKRKLKSPYQVMALKNLYSEHKYPSEEMRAELAEEIGLTARQVSCWFSNRRVKDKQLGKDKGNNIGSRDLSVQDGGSEHHLQDSCGSTKQTDYMNSEPREVESQKLYEGSYQMENVDGVESENSSSSHGHHLVSNYNAVCDVSHSRVVTPLHPQVVQSYVHKPSGYLKVKRVIGEGAVTAIKRLLGRNYHEDGPPIGIDFDPLPPEAFEFPTKDIVQEPYCSENQRRSYSPYVIGVGRNSNPGLRYGVQNSEIYSLDPYLEDDDDIAVGNGSSFRDKKSHDEPRLKPPTLNYYDSFPDQNSFKEMHKGSPQEIPLNNSKKSWIVPKHVAEGVNNQSNININQISQHDYDSSNVSTAREKSEYFTKPSNLVPLGGCRSPDSMKRGPSFGKPEKYYGERSHVKVHRDTLHSIDGQQVVKQVKQGYILQGYTRKEIHGVGGQRRGN